MTAIEEAVIKIVTKELRLKAGVVTLESDLREDLGVDSLDALEIVVALEDHFKTELPTTTHENLITVKDVVDTLIAHKVK
jgi:acyl carrier protein